MLEGMFPSIHVLCFKKTAKKLNVKKEVGANERDFFKFLMAFLFLVPSRNTVACESIYGQAVKYRGDEILKKKSASNPCQSVLTHIKDLRFVLELQPRKTNEVPIFSQAGFPPTCRQV